MAGSQVDGLDSAISRRETQNDMRWMGAGLEEGLRLANPATVDGRFPGGWVGFCDFAARNAE